MGHRANYVIIKAGRAKAYYDHWGALACLLVLGDGPDQATSVAETNEPTTKLLDWGFCEGGFLIDYDERRCITFGYVDIDGDDMPANMRKELAAFGAAFAKGPAGVFKFVAPVWPGWTLEWNEQGADAFADHLERRGITGIQREPRSKDDHGPPYVLKVPDAAAKKKSAPRKPKKAPPKRKLATKKPAKRQPSRRR